MCCIRIESIDRINYYKSELKKRTGKAARNFYMNDDLLKDYLDHSEVLCEFVPGKYLNLYCRDEGFWRLFYFIADFNGYDCRLADGPVICDILLKQEDAEFDAVQNALFRNGFSEYARYLKWSRNDTKNGCISEKTSVLCVYDEQAHGNQVEQLYECFDKYTEYLPRKNEIEAFKENRGFINIYDSADKKNIIGSLIYTRNAKVVTEDFIYVDERMRRAGIASMLDSIYQEKFRDGGYKYVAWTKDDNTASISFHRKHGYTRDKLHKVTYKRG